MSFKLIFLVIFISLFNCLSKPKESNIKTIVLQENSVRTGVSSVSASPMGNYFIVHDSRMKAALYDSKGNLLRNWFFSDSLYGKVYGKKSEDYFKFVKNLSTPKHILKDKRLAALPLEKRQQIIENNKLAVNLMD